MDKISPADAEDRETEVICGFSGELSGDMLASLFGQSLDCIKILSVEGELNFMTRNGRSVMEIDDFSQFAGQFWWSLWPRESQGIVREAVSEAGSGRQVRFEAFCPTAKGSPRWWEVSISPVNDSAGMVTSLISISRDITGRVNDRQHLETIAQEMRHRLGNAFAISASVALASARAMPAHKDFASALADRFSHLAVAQTYMLDAVKSDISLEKLVHSLTNAFSDIDRVLEIGTLPQITVDDSMARVIALVIGELCTNSHKHGALGNGGSVRLGATVNGDELLLKWSERLLHAIEKPDNSTSGSGFKLIERMISVHRGSFRVEWQANGCDVDFSLPLGHAHQGDRASS